MEEQLFNQAGSNTPLITRQLVEIIRLFIDNNKEESPPLLILLNSCENKTEEDCTIKEEVALIVKKQLHVNDGGRIEKSFIVGAYLSKNQSVSIGDIISKKEYAKLLEIPFNICKVFNGYSAVKSNSLKKYISLRVQLLVHFNWDTTTKCLVAMQDIKLLKKHEESLEKLS